MSNNVCSWVTVSSLLSIVPILTVAESQNNRMLKLRDALMISLDNSCFLKMRKQKYRIKLDEVVRLLSERVRIIAML